jgi:hypothetical protein
MALFIDEALQQGRDGTTLVIKDLSILLPFTCHNIAFVLYCIVSDKRVISAYRDKILCIVRRIYMYRCPRSQVLAEVLASHDTSGGCPHSQVLAEVLASHGTSRAHSQVLAEVLASHGASVNARHDT